MRGYGIYTLIRKEVGTRRVKQVQYFKVPLKGSVSIGLHYLIGGPRGATKYESHEPIAL